MRYHHRLATLRASRRRPPLGGTGCVAGLDSATNTMLWHSENSDALTRSVGPAVPEGSQPGRVYSVDPQSARGSATRGEGSSCGVAPGRADAAVASGSHDKCKGRAEPPAEEDSCDRGKGHADPMDEDEPLASSSDEGEGWGRF